MFSFSDGIPHPNIENHCKICVSGMISFIDGRAKVSAFLCWLLRTTYARMSGVVSVKSIVSPRDVIRASSVICCVVRVLLMWSPLFFISAFPVRRTVFVSFSMSHRVAGFVVLSES